MARERFTLHAAGDARALANRATLDALAPIADVYGRERVYAVDAAGAIVPIPATRKPPAPLAAFTDAARNLHAAGAAVESLERKLASALDAERSASARYRRELARERARLTPADIPADFEVRPLPLDADTDAAGVAVCGTCGLAWNDSEPTALTPAPAGRCPFEYFHADADADE